MYGKGLFFLTLVVVGAVLPYLLAEDDWLAKMESMVGFPDWEDASEMDLPEGPAPMPESAGLARVERPSSRGRSATTRPTTTTTLDADTWEHAAASARLPSHDDLEPQLVGPSDLTLTQLLSFDITPGWLSENWSRVTTRLADLDLQGWRVPLSIHNVEITVAGSITYYFDRARHVQRILLHGYTGDATELVNLAIARYQMRRIPSTLSDLYVGQQDGQTVGGLRITYARIMNDTNANKRCEVLLELNRRGSKYGMSREFLRILSRAREEDQILAPISSNPPPNSSRIGPSNLVLRQD